MSSRPGHSSQIPVQPGERLAGRYVVERVLGTGGMGVVVAAHHEQLGRTVAIKILTISTDLHPDAVDRFLREARAAASLRSEHIARVMDVGTDERGRHFIVMEYLEGEDLGAVVRRGQPLSISQAVGYLLQACEALAEAHNQGIIHRDLKPENLFLTRRVDGSPLIKVLDFGISKMTSPERHGASLSASGPRSLLGSPLYMSPEQIRTPSGIDPRSDVWALGVILFELLAGRRPFQGQSLPDILAAILTAAPPPLLTVRADAPPALVDVVASCLDKDVNRRMGSVGLLAQSLRQWAPRWAQDSAARAARMSGVVTQSTGAIDLNLLSSLSSLNSLNVPNGPAPPSETIRPPTTDQRTRDDHAGDAPDSDHPGTRRRGLTVGLLIVGVACGLLTARAWRIYHSPRFNPAAVGLATPPLTVPALVETAVSPLPAAPAPPAVAEDPVNHDILRATTTRDTDSSVLHEVSIPTALPAAVGAATPGGGVVPATPPRMNVAAPLLVKSKSSRTIHHRANGLHKGHPSSKERAAVPLDPLEGRK